MFFNDVPGYRASGIRELHEQRLRELWPGDESYREAHRRQLDLAALMINRLNQIAKLRSDCALLVNIWPQKTANSRAELHLLRNELQAAISIHHAQNDERYVKNDLSLIKQAQSDYPRNLTMRWQRYTSVLSASSVGDIEHAALAATTAVLNKCQERAEKQLAELYGEIAASPTQVLTTVLTDSALALAGTSSQPTRSRIQVARLDSTAAIKAFGFRPGRIPKDSISYMEGTELLYKLRGRTPAPSTVFNQIYFRPKFGYIGQVIGLSSEFLGDSTGNLLREYWQHFYGLIAEEFGAGNVIDFSANSQLTQKNDWLKYIKQGLNELSSTWIGLDTTHADLGIKSICLMVVSNNPNGGQLKVIYSLCEAK